MTAEDDDVVAALMNNEYNANYVSLCGYRGEVEPIKDVNGYRLDDDELDALYGPKCTKSFDGCSMEYVNYLLNQSTNNMSFAEKQAWQFVLTPKKNIWHEEGQLRYPLFVLRGKSGSGGSITPRKIAFVHSGSCYGYGYGYPIPKTIDIACV
eukprot:UN10580